MPPSAARCVATASVLNTTNKRDNRRLAGITEREITMTIEVTNQTTEAELQAVFVVNQLQQRNGLPGDVLALAVSALPSIASIAAQFDTARKGQGTDPMQVKATRERYRHQLAEVSQAAIVRVNERLGGVLKAMTPATADPVVLTEYRRRMAEMLRAPGDVTQAYYEACESHDDVSAQAIEQAPVWDRLFALSEDQRQRGRRLRWGDQAEAAEALEHVRFHLATVTETVRQHIEGARVADPLDALLAR